MDFDCQIRRFINNVFAFIVFFSFFFFVYSQVPIWLIFAKDWHFSAVKCAMELFEVTRFWRNIYKSKRVNWRELRSVCTKSVILGYNKSLNWCSIDDLHTSSMFLTEFNFVFYICWVPNVRQNDRHELCFIVSSMKKYIVDVLYKYVLYMKSEYFNLNLYFATEYIFFFKTNLSFGNNLWFIIYSSLLAH